MDRRAPAPRLALALAGIVASGAPTGAALTVGVAPLAGCLPCRAVDVQVIDLDCATSSSFRGELHLGDADAWRAFLTDRCLVGDADAEVDAAVGAVDFAGDAVFVARGPRGTNGRCIERRAVESVAVCDEGLRVVFADEESGDVPCPGDWTVAFALPRGDLRAAIDDDDAAEVGF